MDRGSGMAIADRFAAYVGELTKVVGHADRAGPLRDYCSVLLATEGRRSVEPMAAVTRGTILQRSWPTAGPEQRKPDQSLSQSSVREVSSPG